MRTKFRQNSPLADGVTHQGLFPLFVKATGLAISLLLLVFCVFQVCPQLNDKSSESGAPQIIKTVNLLSAERFIHAGAQLSEASFRRITLPRSQTPEGAVAEVEEIKNYFAKVDLQPGVPVLRSQLMGYAEPPGLPLLPGHVAVSFQVNTTAGIVGRLLPGANVDVVLSLKSQGSLNSKIIVRNARVITVGRQFTYLDKLARADAPSEPGGAITLDVSCQDALQIAISKQLGPLDVLVRTQATQTPTTPDR